MVMHDTNWHWSYGLWLQCIEMVLGKKALKLSNTRLNVWITFRGILNCRLLLLCMLENKIFNVKRNREVYLPEMSIWCISRTELKLFWVQWSNGVSGVVKGYINTYLARDYNSLHRETIRLNGGIESGRRGLNNASPVVHKYWSKC